MSFKYDVVNEITNEDFKASNRGLLSSCQEIERKYNRGDLADCCRDVRNENENILRYLYDRIIGIKNRRNPPMAGEIIHDKDFLSQLENVSIIHSAKNIRRLGNKVAHSTFNDNESSQNYERRMQQYEQELLLDTNSILDFFSTFLESSINYINSKLSGVRGHLNILFQTITNQETGLEDNVLMADLTDVIDRKDYKYVWKIEGSQNNFREKTNKISLNKRWMIGKKIILEAHHKTSGQVLKSSYGPIKGEEIILSDGTPLTKKMQEKPKEKEKDKRKDKGENDELKRTEKIDTMPEKVISYEKTVVNKDGKPKKIERKTPQKGCLFALDGVEDLKDLSTIEDSKEIGAPAFKCFDSNVSRLQYFIAPRNEDYVTNSLRYLDYYEFLSEMLKEQGYQRVILISHKSENKSDNFPVITFDKVSELTFLNPIKFNEFFMNIEELDYAMLRNYCDNIEKEAISDSNPIRSSRGGKRNSENIEKEKSLSFGRRVIRTISSGSQKEKNRDTFSYFLDNYVVPALEQSILKTAIVFPMEILCKKEHVEWMLSSNLRDQIERVGDNIMIVTADQNSMLSKLFEIPEYENIEKEIFNAISTMQESEDPISHSNAIIDALSVIRDGQGRERKKVRILVANNRPGKDEIANFLLLKKMEEPDSYKDLQDSKVYALAEYLYSNCDTGEHTEKNFPELSGNNTWHLNSMALFENNMKKSSVRTAVIKKSWELFERTILNCRNWKSTCIERIYSKLGAVPLKKDRKISCSGQEIVERASMTAKEKEKKKVEAMAKLDELIGLKEVKENLKGVLSAASNPIAFKDRQGPGHYIFSGSPGTGKTTVARLVGEILHSENILKKGHVVEVKKTDLVSEHIGGTQIKAMVKFEEALDGILFFDEAYELINTESNAEGKFKSSFDEEAYTLLMKFMEDNANRVCVICAGYKESMEKFLNANDGMRSRFTSTIDFPDYNAEELFEIFKLILRQKTGLRPTEGYLNKSKKVFEHMAQEALLGLEKFGNARDVRSYIEESIRNASLRDSRTKEIHADDIPKKYQ